MTLFVYITHGGIGTIKGVARSFLNKNSHENQIIAHYKNGIYTLLSSQMQFNHEQFVAFIVSQGDVFRLCCDANLGDSGGEKITEKMTLLVNAFMPQELLLFSAEPLCVTHANNHYLNSDLPFVSHAIAVDPAGIKSYLEEGIPLRQPMASIIQQGAYDNNDEQNELTSFITNETHLENQNQAMLDLSIDSAPSFEDIQCGLNNTIVEPWNRSEGISVVASYDTLDTAFSPLHVPQNMLQKIAAPNVSESEKALDELVVAKDNNKDQANTRSDWIPNFFCKQSAIFVVDDDHKDELDESSGILTVKSKPTYSN